MKLFSRKLFDKFNQNTRDTEQYRRFENIMQYSRMLIDRTKDDPVKQFSIFCLIKLLSAKITNDNVLEVIQTNKTICDPYRSLDIDSLLMDKNTDLIKLFYSELVLGRDITKKFNVDLDADPVITTVWEKGRLINTLSDIGIPSNEWKEQRLNHYANLFLPLGLCILDNGFHSTYSGIIKAKGSFAFNDDCNHHIYDITPSYDYMLFDGVYYKTKDGNRILGRGLSFEFGCIYEIGRIISENNISFLNSK